MSITIGFIAEDLSDIEVIKILIKKISGKTYSSAHFVGKGCGPIKKKIPGWTNVFRFKGVDSLLVVHDLDNNDEKTLRHSLESLVEKTPFCTKAVVIPKEELEAWLLCDEDAIYTALNLEKRPKPIIQPERIKSPKEHLRDLTQSHSKGRQKQYINTIHNKLIAKEIASTKLNKCPSFNHLKAFINATLN